MEILEEEQLRLLRTPFGLEQRAKFVHLDRIHEEVEEDVLIPSAFAPVVVAAGRRARETGETGSSRYSPREIAAAVAEGTARKSGFNTRVATAAGEAGRKGFIEPAAGTRRSGVCTEAAAEELEPGVETAVLPTVLIVGDQNAGKTSFLYCFSRNLFLQQLQLSSFLPILRASFLNARLLFFSKQQVHRLRQAAARGTAQPPQAAATTAPAATASSATAQSATAQSATAQSATAQSATAQAAVAPDAGAPAAAITAPATAAASRLIASTAPARPRTASPKLAARERFASRAAGSNRPPAKAEAAAANTSTLPMSPSDTCLERDDAESAVRGENGGTEGLMTRMKRIQGTGDEASDICEAEEDAAILTLARDELPFLDSDVARALTLFTLEDFLFFCDEFHVPFSRSHNKQHKTSDISSNNPKRGNSDSSSSNSWGRSHRYSSSNSKRRDSSDSSSDLNSSKSNSSSSSRESNDKEGDVTATCLNSLQAAGIRYVAVHLLEFGGDHLDRLLRFFQLTGKPDIYSIQGNLSSSSEDRPHTYRSAKECCSSSSDIHTLSSSEKYSRSSSNIEIQGRAEKCSSTSNTSTWSKELPDSKACGSAKRSMGESRASENMSLITRASSSILTGRHATSTSSASSRSSIRETPACSCDLENAQQPFAHYTDELQHWRIIVGRGSVTENALAATAAEKILRDEQHRFEKTLVARARAAVTIQTNPGASSIPVRAPYRTCRFASPSASGNHVASVSNVPKAAPGTSAMWGEETGSSAAGRQDAFSTADRAARQLSNPNTSVRHDPIWKKTATAAYERASGAPLAAKGVSTTGGREACAREAREGKTSLSAIAAETSHKPVVSCEVCRQEGARTAEATGKCVAAEDKEECNRNTKEFLKVLRRSAQLLSDTAHTLYFLNCRSLIPTSLATPCNRACCCISGVRTPQLCFKIDPTAFSTCLGRLSTIAMVKWYSTFSHEDNNNGSRRAGSAPSQKRNQEVHSGNSNSSRCNSGHQSWNSRSGIAAETQSGERPKISFICCRLVVPPPLPTFASKPRSGSTDGRVIAEGGRTTGRTCEQELLERCCSCCTRENFKIALHVLQCFNTKEQEQQEGSILQRHRRHNFADDTLPFTDSEGILAGASRAAPVAATSVGPATKETPAGSRNTGTPKLSNSGELQAGEEAAELSDTSLKKNRACPKVSADESTHAEELEREKDCDNMTSRAEDEEARSGFRLFMHFLQEAAAAAVIAARSAKVHEEAELAIAAEEELALRCSPHFLFIHALLHFMWACHAAGDPGASAAAGLEGPEAALDQIHAAAREGNVEAVEAAQSTPLKERDIVKTGIETKASTVWAPDTTAQRMDAAPSGIPKCSRKALPGGMNATLPGGVVANKESICTSSGAAEKASEDAGEQVGCLCHDLTGRRNEVLSEGSHSTKQELHTLEANREKEALQQVSLRRMCDHGLSSQLHQICSRLQLSTIYPVQLLDAVNRVRQQQVLPPLTPQMPMEQQQLQSLSALELASLEEQQQQHQHQLDNRKNTQVWRFPHQQVQQQCKEDVREAYQKQRLWRHPGTVDRQQQQERLVGIHQGEGEQLEGGEEERKKSLTLLQPPFSVGAVVNLFAELLRLTCVQRQNQHTSAGMVPFASGMREPAAGVEAGTFLDERAGLSPSVSLTPAAAWSRGQRMRGQQEQPATANSSPMTYGAAIADEVRGKVRKGKVSKKIAAARAPARRLKLPTGELGRQLLLMFLRLVKKRRRLVQLCLSSKKSSDEAQSAALSESLASRERGLDPSLFFVNVNINCWFSLLDAAVLLNDGEMDEDEDDVAFSATQKQENTPGSEIYNCMGTGFAVVVPEARRKLLTGDSTSTCSMSCGGAVLLAAESGGRPVTGATTAHGATSQAAAEARRVCTFCEEYHERMEQVAAPAEEEAFVPHSTFLQLFPNLLEGLMDAGAALPYCDSAAPFPPVLLELRWVRQPPFPYNRTPAKEEQPSLPAHCAAPSVLSERPRKAGGALPRASEESRICSSFTGALPASRLTAPAGNLTLHAGVELGTREKQATEAAMETWQASENALSIPEECRLAREVDQCSPSACMWSPAARDPAAAEESHTPKTASSVALKTFASPCSTTTARPRAGVEENSCMSECYSSGVMPTLGAVLLAPAGLLRRLRTDNDPARKSPGKRHAAGSDVFSKEIKKGAFSAKRAVEAKRDCKNGAFYVADDVDTDGAAFAEESTRKEGCAVRLALQEQLFNYIYYHFQKDVRAGPLPEDYWRHINWTRKHGSNGGPECFTSRGNRSGWRDSCNETKVDKHIQTQCLESVEECVLKSLNMQLLLLCESLRKFAACVTQQGRDDIPSRTHRTNLDVHPISNMPIMLQQRDNPAGSDFGAVCRPATQLLQQGHPQTNQPQEKQDAKIREQQHCDQQVTEQETDLREYAYNRSLKNHPVSHPLSAPGNTSLASSAAAVEVATAAHMLLQLAGDVALIARIKGSAFEDDISSARWGCCSGETIEVSVDAATEARANSAARPWNGDVSNKVMDPLALRTATTEAPEVVEASEGANTPIAAFRESIATVDGRPAAESESLYMTAAGGCEVLTGDALLSATGSSIIINRGQLSGERRHSTCIKDPKEERTGISGCGCGMLRWWVKDEKCSAGIIPVRKVVIEVTGGNGADGGRPHGESSSNVHAFPPSRFSTSCAVCTHQVEVDSLAALDSVLRYASYFQQQQEYHDGTQNAQYRKTSQRICQLNDPKAHAERKQHTEAQRKNAVTAFHVQDYTKSTFSMDNVLCPVHEATTVTAKTEAACSWLNLLCQLEQRENISLTLL